MRTLLVRRRHRSGRRTGLLAGLITLLAAASCSRPAEHGPVALQWNHASCERCAMAIGDRRFAAEVRGALDRRVHVFDDLGCALLWLDDHREQEGPATEIWVRDPLGEHWIDARSARYANGQHTPMGYGFAVVEPDERPDSLALERVRALVAREERARGQR